MTTRWDHHFLQLCLDHARMSKDPSMSVGAVIVGPDREIRSAGFNGFPRGIADTKERLSDRDVKLQLVVHAEMNAVLAAARVGVPGRQQGPQAGEEPDSGVGAQRVPPTSPLVAAEVPGRPLAVEDVPHAPAMRPGPLRSADESRSPTVSRLEGALRIVSTSLREPLR